MSLTGDIYRYLLSIFTDKPSRFGWVIKDELAASGRPMTRSQIAWVANNGIKSVLTIRDYPLPSSWFPPLCNQLQSFEGGKLRSSANRRSR
jgi:atypical dual specificity phosphatase